MTCLRQSSRPLYIRTWERMVKGLKEKKSKRAYLGENTESPKLYHRNRI